MWSKVDQIIKIYRKDYPERWQSFVDEMNFLRSQEMGEGSFRLSAKFPTYPDETDISERIMKFMPDLIINDKKWYRFKREWPVFFR